MSLLYYYNDEFDIIISSTRCFVGFEMTTFDYVQNLNPKEFKLVYILIVHWGSYGSMIFGWFFRQIKQAKNAEHP